MRGLQNHTANSGGYSTLSHEPESAIHKFAFMSSPRKASSGALASTLHVKTSRHTECVNITTEVDRCVAASGVSSGVCHLYVPHTTAGVTINEGDDLDVARDMEAAFDRMVPREAGYKHYEGNSDSHIKSSLVGCSQTVWIENGRLRLGRWQAIFFCEFDGPRNREVLVKIVPDPPV
jgi:secondary thiamine-phosphate synthase enzyme